MRAIENLTFRHTGTLSEVCVVLLSTHAYKTRCVGSSGLYLVPRDAGAHGEFAGHSSPLCKSASPRKTQDARASPERYERGRHNICWVPTVTNATIQESGWNNNRIGRSPADAMDFAFAPFGFLRACHNRLWSQRCLRFYEVEPQMSRGIFRSSA